MANTTSSNRRRPRRAAASFAPAPERLRPLRYKTALRVAFERAMVRDLGVPAAVIAEAAGPTKLTATWKGTRAV